MATQKERPDSWKARGLIKRDFQHDHSGPEEMPHRKKGGNGKWCGKKVGRVCEFTEKVMKWSSQRYRAYVMECPVCHKQKGYFHSRLVEYTDIYGNKQSYWTSNGY